MPRDEDLQWIELTDFSPGIFSNNQLAGGVQVTSTNVAMASPTNTFRCRALPTGGLGPLPRLVDSFGLTDIPDGGGGFTYTVAGFSSWGRIFTGLNNGVELHAMIYWQEPNGGNVDAHLAWVRERQFDPAPSTEVILQKDATNVSSSAPRYTYFLKTRMFPSSPTDTSGSPVMVCVSTRVSNNDLIISRAWPDPDNPNTNGTIIVGEAAEAHPYVVSAAHQGRVVLARFVNYDHGIDANLVTNENIYWTAVNDNTLSDDDPATFVPELDQSITDLCPMSANALIVIKWYGGGYVLQGDLDDVTVVQLPNLPCPDGSDYVRGVNTGSGFIYSAGAAGIYLWNGGDGARLISPQLTGDFAIGDNFISGANGQMDRWIDLVLVPQSWVWDSTHESWWRIEDPEVANIRYWTTSAFDSRAFGADTQFTDASPDFMFEFHYDDLAYTYSWQSHPLWVSQGRRMELRHGLVALQGHGTVTITFSDEDGNEFPTTIAVDTDDIRNFRFDIGLDAENLTIRIEASGDDGDGPGTFEAPLVHRCYIGWVQAQHLANLANSQ